jgi:hypothetical protein
MPDLMPLVTQLVDLSKVKVDATVTLREAELDVGGAMVKVDPRTTFSVKGDGQHATLSGHVQLDGFGLDQGGVKLSSTGGGQADLSATLDRLDGGYALDARLEQVKFSIDRLESARPSALAPGAIDRLAIGPSEVRGGTIRLTSKVDLSGLRPTNFSPPTVAMRLQASGTINDASLTVKDTKDTALAGGRRRLQGHARPGARRHQARGRLDRCALRAARPAAACEGAIRCRSSTPPPTVK